MPYQYLNHYAEPEANLAATLMADCGVWDKVLTIPALDEAPEFLQRLAERPERVLVILVVNQTTAPITPTNQCLINKIAQHYCELKKQGHLSLYTFGTGSLLIVDRANHPLPAKTGVGLARKIAADIALGLILQKKINSQWIYCSDADAQLPDDYFSLDEQSTSVAASLPFTHVGTPGLLLDATTLYEHAIRYYTQGLRFAGSDYGFLSLGSALAVKATAYAKVRGFNLKEAGEDFYLLNKLAKIGTIATPDSSPIRIAARLSNRTPFGTGACVAQMCALPTLNDFTYYSPACFHMLKFWFDLVPTINQHNFKESVSSLPSPLVQALTAQNIDTLADHIKRQGKNSQQIASICHTWLDGFRTLKIIRHLQAHSFPAEPLIKSLALNPFSVK